ncbi:MAG: imidazoleglycerol-phosphate dehydratase HisB [archaeon]
MRKAKVVRETAETRVSVELNLDGKGKADVKTPLRFLSHMLQSLGKHSGFGLKVTAESRDGDEHHIAEDVGICLGEALLKALGDKKGIERFGYWILPMDDAVATVAVDLSGRPYFKIELPFSEFDEKMVGDVSKENIEHFLESFALNGKFNLCVKAEGKNDHHKVEAVFKALAKSLKVAASKSGSYDLPSTKGVL